MPSVVSQVNASDSRYETNGLIQRRSSFDYLPCVDSILLLRNLLASLELSHNPLDSNTDKNLRRLCSQEEESAVSSCLNLLEMMIRSARLPKFLSKEILSRKLSPPVSKIFVRTEEVR